MKNKMIILLASLIAVIICLVFYNKSKRIVAPETGEKTIGDKPIATTMSAEHGAATSPENGFILPDGVDPELVDREIIGSGYRPSTEQEWTKLRKSVSVDYYGAKTRLTFHVTDSEGRNVSNATVMALFSTDKEVKVVGGTDKDGIFVAEGRSSYSLNYVVNKDGHYETRAVHSFSARNGFDVVNDRWVPWNPTVSVRLNEKRNPIPLYVKQAGIRLPQKGETFGYDFKIGDLVAPHGKGEYADIFLNSWGDKPIPLTHAVSRHLTLSFENDGEGLVRKKKYTQSIFTSLHEAPEDGYQSEVYLNYSRTNDKILENNDLSKDEYLIFRSRVEGNENGEIVSAHYGKIRDLWFDISADNLEGAAVSFTYYFNPTPNDRNIEYDPKQNLFGGRDHFSP